jgi:hypothetical protein
MSATQHQSLLTPSQTITASQAKELFRSLVDAPPEHRSWFCELFSACRGGALSPHEVCRSRNPRRALEGP